MYKSELRQLSPVDSAAEELLGGRSPYHPDEESTDFGTASENESDNTSRPSSRTGFLRPDSDGTEGDSTTLPRGAGEGSGAGESGGGGGPRVVKYRVYLWRWFMLATIFLLNVSNGMMWLTYAPIPNYTAAFYRVALSQVDWFSLSYFITSLLVGFVSIAILDTWGLKVSLYLGAVFNVTGSALRWLSTAEFITCSPIFPQSGFLVAIIGQVLTACAQPFLLYSPTKLAALWFGPKERAFCTMLASLGNPIGIAVAQLVSPNIVTSTDRLPILMLTYTVPAIVLTVATLLAFWRKAPPVPPAPSADKVSIPFFKGLKDVLTNLSFWVLLVVWGCSAGLFNALLTLLAQILCPFGYSVLDSGLWGSLMIFCGLVGATIAGVIIDYTKKYKEVAVVSLSLTLLCFVWFTEVPSVTGQSVNIAFSLCFLGFFALPLIPAFMELGVEITYPVAEATSSGLLWSAVQMMGIILVFVGQTVQYDVSPDHSKCAIEPISSNSTTYSCLSPQYNSSMPVDSVDTPKDLTYALLIYVGIGFLVLILLVAGFHPNLKRLEVEKRAQMLAKLQQETPSTSASSLSIAASDSVHVEPDRIKLGDASPPIRLLRTSRLSEYNTKL